MNPLSGEKSLGSASTLRLQTIEVGTAG